MNITTSASEGVHDEAVGVDDVDAAVARVKAARAAWAATSLSTKARLLDECRDRFFAVAPRMVDLGLRMKGLTPTQPEAGEEWAFVTGTLKLFRAWARALRETSTSGRPTVMGPWTVRPDLQGRGPGQVVVQVGPDDLAEKLTMGGGTAEVWLEPGLSLAEARAGQGARLQAPPQHPTVLALLAAGNVPMLLVGDVLHALLLRGAVVVAKLNPVNADLLPLWQEAFAPLIEPGCLALIAGDASVGARLTTHSDVDAVHMTGSTRTHDAVVFGPDAGGSGLARVVQNRREVTAELGNVTPVLVVPGPWTAGELRYHAIQLGSQHGLNAAFNCLTPRLVVTSSSWPQRRAFLDELRAFFSALPTRRAYYPGARDRHARFCAGHDGALRLGAPRLGGPRLGGPLVDDALPWTLIEGLRLDGERAADSATNSAAEPCFEEESFCAVLAEATVDGADAPTFLRRAVELVNERVFGNLTVTLLVHPQTAKQHTAAVDDAIARLRYGNVNVNTFGTIAYVTPSLPWGAFPGNATTDIQSGTGHVHNVVDLPAPQKSVVRVPFTMGKTPPINLLWPQTTPLLREVAALEHRPGLRAGFGVVRALIGL